jgi:ketosteroid isomerase-like protein
MSDPAQLAQRWFDAIDAGDLDQFDAILAPDIELHVPGARLQGVEAAKGWMRPFITAFPDITHPIYTLRAFGDTAVVELHPNGTHTQPFVTPAGTVPPTGKKVELRVANVMTVTGDRLSAVHIYFDQVELLSQLGLMGG